MSPEQYDRVMDAVRKAGCVTTGDWGLELDYEEDVEDRVTAGWGSAQCALGCLVRQEKPEVLYDHEFQDEDEPNGVLEHEAAAILHAGWNDIVSFIGGFDGDVHEGDRDAWWAAGHRMRMQCKEEGLLK